MGFNSGFKGLKLQLPKLAQTEMPIGTNDNVF